MENLAMGKYAKTERKYAVQQMWEVHHEISRMILLGMGNREIADHLGVTPVMVSYTRNSPVVKRQLALMGATRDVETLSVADEIRELLPRAVEVLAETMESGLENMRLKAATEILDRGGFPKTVRTENVSAMLTADDLRDIKELARTSGLVVDVTPSET